MLQLGMDEESTKQVENTVNAAIDKKMNEKGVGASGKPQLKEQ